MKSKHNNILVTGGAGFIGFNLIKKLLNSKKNIFVIDNFSTGYNKNFPKNIKLLKGDCKDYSIFQNLKNYKIDTVIHLAGVSSVEASFDDPIKDANSNIISTLNVLRFVKEKNIKNFIFSSSMCVYGNLGNNVNESDATKPISFYGISKLTSEEYIRFCPLPNTTKVILRLFNVYGPGSDKKNTKHGMVGIYLNQILESNKVVVNGKLSRFRDFVFIDDVISIIEKCIKIKNKKCNIFNVCTSKKTYVKDLIEKIFKIKNKKAIIFEKKSTPGDQFGIFGNNQKIKKFLRLKKIISIEEGLKKTV